MTRIVQLLQQKNHYLEKFFSLNESELLGFKQGRFDSLEYFYQTREKILEQLRYIDGQLAKTQEDLPIEERPHRDIREEVMNHLAMKDQYVREILNQDLQILACIEEAKSAIIRELQEVRRSKRAVSGYKSKPMNHRLNEEA
ncbi:MAG: hypothetical protein C5B49_02450 [Bdellovibrio sp.]|nr:MAG: hypothetical protein C5B49_02450 [Bdellovibrio sp.]